MFQEVADSRLFIVHSDDDGQRCSPTLWLGILDRHDSQDCSIPDKSFPEPTELASVEAFGLPGGHSSFAMYNAQSMTRRHSQAWRPLFGYSTNVHKTSTLRDIYRFLGQYTIPIKERVFGDSPGGLELHLSMSTAGALRQRGKREEFKAFLDDAALQLFSVNAYPLKPFHTQRVKEKVYSPSWTEPDRVRWTNTIADILADLLAPDVPGSVSTLGGAFRHKEHGPSTFKKLARNYLKTVAHLERLEVEMGKRIVLAVEPEPETTFETATDVIRFVEDYLLPAAFADRSFAGRRRSTVEGVVRRYFTTNFDTCHFSVLYQDLVGSLRQLSRAGIAVGKIHVTNAIRLRNPFRAASAYQDFRRMHEPRYFHQFCGVDGDGKTIWRDLDLDRLPRKLDAKRHPPVAELRSHYHVPLYLKRFQRLLTTQEDTELALKEIRRARTTRHVVLETYTWPILADENRLLRGITREFRWMLDALGVKR